MTENAVLADFGPFVIYWFGVWMALAVAASSALFVRLRARQGIPAADSLRLAVCALPAALVSARLFYVWFAGTQFDGAGEGFNPLTGGFALYGAVGGLLAAAAADSRIARRPLLPALDALCPALALAVAAEKGAGLCCGSDRGFAVTGGWQRFPLALPDASDGTWRLWVGFFEGLTALLLLLAETGVFLRRTRGGRTRRGGDVTLLAMLLFGFSQTFWESMRDDSLYMVTLGFVRISQVLSFALGVAALVILHVRAARHAGVRTSAVCRWILCAAALGLAFYCEFTMNAASLTRNYGMMGGALCLVTADGLALLFAMPGTRRGTEK